MLLNFKNLIEQYRMNIRGVVQVGAHWGQEFSEYREMHIRNIIFIEPCRDAFQRLNDKFKNEDGVLLFNTACGNERKKQVMYTEHSNTGMSNSLLAPEVHLTQHPDVIFDSTEEVDVTPLDMIPFYRPLFNCLNMDVQGFEGMVLKGAAQTLNFIDYIYTEVNRQSMYKDCALVDELDQMLPDFKRVETAWASDYHGWGDALYIRKTLL